MGRERKLAMSSSEMWERGEGKEVDENSHEPYRAHNIDHKPTSKIEPCMSRDGKKMRMIGMKTEIP